MHIAETARGGLGTYIDLLTELERGTVDSRVILPDAHADVLNVGISRRTFRYPRRSASSLARLAWVAIHEKFKFRPDIFFCHSTFTLLPLILLRALSLNTKFIYCAHGWAGAREMSNQYKAALVRAVEGKLCGLAHRVVNISIGDKEHADQFNCNGRQIVIENAVRPPRANAARLALTGHVDSIHLLFVGRLDRQKGLDLLLDAFSQARAKNPSLILHVIGDAVVDKAKTARKAQEGVEFLGWIDSDRIDSYYSAANLVVVPSRWEEFGLVVAEAYRNGVLVLVSDRGALPTLVDHGVTGYIVPLEITSWIEALANLDRAKLFKMQAATLEMFRRRYSADRLGRDIANLYQDLMTE